MGRPLGPGGNGGIGGPPLREPPGGAVTTCYVSSVHLSRSKERDVRGNWPGGGAPGMPGNGGGTPLKS